MLLQENTRFTSMRILTSIFFLLLSTHMCVGQNQGELVFSIPGGYYEFDTTLSISSSGSQEIYYTLDGNIPTKSSIKYRHPIRIIDNMVIRARTYSGSKGYGKTYTITFLRERLHQLPVACITVPPALLFDSISGLYMLGPNAGEEEPNWGANFWKKTELQIHLAYFVDNQLVLNQPSGLKMFGGFSRSLPQKSFSIHARSEYGEKHLSYPFFKDLKHRQYKKIVLRNGGSDWGLAYFRDALMSGLLRSSNLDLQSSQPCVVYINAQYWGIYFIREKVGKHFLKDHHPKIEKDHIDLLEKDVWVVEGSRKDYKKLLTFMENNELSDSKNYQWVCTQMDVSNYASYMVAEIYYDNIDAGGNIKYWRSHDEGSKWRWILYDTDFGFGKHDREAYLLNSLERHTEANGPSWPNPPWTTFILRKLLENEDFKQLFINRFADYMNSYFRPENVAKEIQHFVDLLDEEMPYHTKRWKRRYSSWKFNVGVVRKFGELRPQYMRQHIADYFSLEGSYQLSLNPKLGSIVVNQQINVDSLWTGQYFNGIPISLEAKHPPEFQFLGWSNGATDNPLLLDGTKDISLYPIYERKKWAEEHGQIIISKFHSRNDKGSSDWVTLYNRGHNSYDLSGWHFYDNKHGFELPQGTILDTTQMLILASDSGVFSEQHPQLKFLVIPFPFGLKAKSERLLLTNKHDMPVDSIRYQMTKGKDFWLRFSPNDSTLTWHYTNNEYPLEILVSRSKELTKTTESSYLVYWLWGLGIVLLIGLVLLIKIK